VLLATSLLYFRRHIDTAGDFHFIASLAFEASRAAMISRMYFRRHSFVTLLLRSLHLRRFAAYYA